MKLSRLVLYGFLSVAPVVATLKAQSVESNPSSIRKEIGGLRSLPEAQRGERTGAVARAIAGLPSGKEKLGLALTLAHLSTEGDPGRANLQAVGDTLAAALGETPVPAAKDGGPSEPYRELASLVRYEGLTLNSPALQTEQYKQAVTLFEKQDAEISSLDFNLKDTEGKKWTLKDLRGKIVMVNFWATWCPPCRVELPNMDAIAAHYGSQGLVILAISDEDMSKISGLLRAKPHFNVLLDHDHVAANEFHVNSLPMTFVLNREGQLAAEARDGRTQRQFLQMLQKAGLTL